MKKLVLVAVMAIGTTFLMSFTKAFNEKKVKTEVVVMQSDYEEGWEDGYCEGWKDVKGEFAICPITPICPIPEIGKDDFRGGYNRAFKAGMKAARQ